MNIKSWLRKKPLFVKAYYLRLFLHRYFPMRRELGSCGDNTVLEYPLCFENRANLFIDSNVRIRRNCNIYNSPMEKVIIKKYTVVSGGCTIITNSHCTIATVPYFILCDARVKDKSEDVVIAEDAWIGANSIILPGANIGRGCIVGAGTVVTKPTQPYSVVAGNPARLISVTMKLEDILRHEEALYPPNERMVREELEELFSTYYLDLPVYGVSSEITNEQAEDIERMKTIRRFIDWK